MKKIIHVMTIVDPYSAGYQLHKSFLSKGYDSKVLCVKSNVDDKNIIVINNVFINFLWRLGYKVEKYIVDQLLNPKAPIKHSLGISFIPFFLLKKYLKDADIINLHWINAGFISISHLKKLSSIKKVFWTHHDAWFFLGSSHHELSSYERNYLLRKVDKFLIHKKKYIIENISHIFPSNWLCEFASEKYKRLNSSVIHNTFDSEVFHNKLIRNTKHTRIKTLGFGAVSANSNPNKGFDLLIKSLNDVLNNHNHNHKFNLMIFGVDNIDEVKSKYNYIFKLANSVEFIPLINNRIELSDIYNRIDTFILPSRIENLSSVLIEAIACGCKCVCFDTGGNKEIVYGNRGFIVEKFNTNEFSKAIVDASFIDIENEGLYDFHFDKVVKQYISFYTGR